MAMLVWIETLRTKCAGISLVLHWVFYHYRKQNFATILSDSWEHNKITELLKIWRFGESRLWQQVIFISTVVFVLSEGVIWSKGRAVSTKMTRPWGSITLGDFQQNGGNKIALRPILLKKHPNYHWSFSTFKCLIWCQFWNNNC